MNSKTVSLSPWDYIAAAGYELDLVKNIQWSRSANTEMDVNAKAIESGLTDLFKEFYPDFSAKTLTVLQLFNGENEVDWRVSAVVGLSQGNYNINDAEHLIVDVRITKPGNKAEYLGISREGELLQSFVRYEDDKHWTVL